MKAKEQKLLSLLQNQLSQTLAFAKEDRLTFEELYVVLYEARVKLSDPQEAQKLKSYFGEEGLQIREVYQLFTPIKYEIVHNMPTFVVKIAKNDMGHRPKQCFDWWKAHMERKYGNQLRWFDAIAMEPQCRRIKSYAFKESVRLLLESTQHRGCAERICQRFPKNTKNEIEWTTFMAVIRHNPAKYACSPDRDKERKTKAHTQYTPEKTVCVWSQNSLQKSISGRTRCQTPSTVHFSLKKKIDRSHKEISWAGGSKTRYLHPGKKLRVSTEVGGKKYQYFL